MDDSAGAFVGSANSGGTTIERDEGSVALVLWLLTPLLFAEVGAVKTGLEWATLRNEVEGCGEGGIGG